jgi:copper homeostasis protein
MQRFLEIACFNLASALIADEGDADRIELCNGFSLGGIAPKYIDFETARRKIEKDIFVMIRPHGGGFIYTDIEFENMKLQLQQFKKMGADGFVFGCLNEDHSICIEQNKTLIDLAYPLPCNMHRAFDRLANFKTNLEAVINCGFKTILTSGTQSSATEGIAILQELIFLANERIEIMPGGGIRSSNIALLKEKLNTAYFHSSAIVKDDVADLNEVKLLKKILNE